MDAVSLLEEARAAGLEVRTEGDQLVVRGPKRLATLALRVLDHKPAILAILEDVGEPIAWRMAAMRPQVPPSGPIPYLVAVAGLPARDTPGTCLSCGDAISPPRRYRCGPCVTAVERVLAEIREGTSDAGNL
jgi:hypothetical protein